MVKLKEKPVTRSAAPKKDLARRAGKPSATGKAIAKYFGEETKKAVSRHRAAGRKVYSVDDAGKVVES